MFRLLAQSIFSKKKVRDEHTIKAHKALFTAMATSLGIGNIVAPIIAIGFGGPGALLGFLLATLFGTATAFTEVSLALKFRKIQPDGTVSGGPMQYLKDGISPLFATIYAVSASVMLLSWSGRQINTVASMLSIYHIPTYISAIAMTSLVMFILLRGIKLIGNVTEKLVPVMFFLYAGSMVWIIALHIQQIPNALMLIFQSVFTPHALLGAGVGLGFQKALQWGLSEAAFANEAGVGTITIPHSMAATKNAFDQGILSMISVYTSGFLALLSGMAILVSGAWKYPHANFDISLLARMLQNHFSTAGPLILLVCVILFAFGATLGNSYNGSQCFLYLTRNRWLKLYYGVIALALITCAMIDVKTLWELGAYFIIPVALPNIVGIVILSFKGNE